MTLGCSECGGALIVRTLPTYGGDQDVLWCSACQQEA